MNNKIEIWALKNSAASAFINFIIKLVRAVILLVLARVYGPTFFGKLSITLASVQTFWGIADFGIDTIAIRRIAGKQNEHHNRFGDIISAKLILGTAAYGLSIVFYLLTFNLSTAFILISGVSIYTISLINAFNDYFQANLGMQKVIKANILGALTFLGLMALAVINRWPAILLLAIFPGSEMVTLISTIRLYKKTESLSLPTIKYARPLDVLKESIPMGVLTIFVMLYSRLDTLIIGRVLGESAVGAYSVASRILEAILIIPVAYSTSFYASLSRAKPELKREQGFLFFKRNGLPLLLGIAFIACIISLNAKYILGLVSTAYIVAAPALIFLCAAMVLRTLSMQLSSVIYSYGKFMQVAAIAFANLVICICLNILFIPKLGIMGAGLAIVIMEVFNGILQAFYLFRILGFGGARIE